MRLRDICMVGTAAIALTAFASPASADVSVGGALAPGSSSGGSSAGAPTATGVSGATGTATGASGTTTGTTGSTGSTGTTGATGASGGTGATGGSGATTHTTSLDAPITLAKGAPSPRAYSGPIYELTASGSVVPYVPSTRTANVNGGTRVGSSSSLPHLLVPGRTGAIIGGIAAAPEAAPASVRAIIWAANAIIGRPYVYGGGHRSFTSRGYDCSGTVSYALHGANLLSTPLDSSEFESWGARGQGRWVTILTNPGHAYLDVAGLRLDTSSADDTSNEQGPRWRPLRPANHGYVIRHPVGI